jgi:DMSO reductase family type II enzyme heme b subunit
MPSYDMPDEDRWALVDYVYALSEDTPGYASSVFAHAVEGAVDLTRGDALFAEAPAARFPVAGQIIEPGRSYFPGVNAITVQAVYDQDDIAFRLTWHDMRAETGGQNSPALPVPDDDSTDPDTSGLYSDAVAIQLPAQMPAGVTRPYFLFGDARNAVDLWFVDLAQGSSVQHFVGKGSDDLTPGSGDVEVTSSYEEGEWSVVFKRSRHLDDGLSFEEDTFVPIAFTVWDGFNRERGNKRGVTTWYHVYIPPMETESAVLPMLGYSLLTLLVGVGLVAITRRKYKDFDPAIV